MFWPTKQRIPRERTWSYVFCEGVYCQCLLRYFHNSSLIIIMVYPVQASNRERFLWKQSLCATTTIQQLFSSLRHHFLEFISRLAGQHYFSQKQLPVLIYCQKEKDCQNKRGRKYGCRLAAEADPARPKPPQIPLRPSCLLLSAFTPGGLSQHHQLR